jgi:uncharacterized protein (UPF0335 family)
VPKLKTPNAEPKTAGDFQGGNSARKELYSFVQRFERLTEEIQGLTEDRKEVMGEAKARGFDTAVLRKVIQRRKLGKAERDEVDAILDLYETAVDAAEAAEFEQSKSDAK